MAMRNSLDKPKVTLTGIITVVTLGFVLVCGGCAGCSAVLGEVSYSDGERTGTITKFSHKGVVWKTWEGEMSLGGFRNNAEGKVQANMWEFTVSDPEVVEEVKKAQRDGGVYTLHYKQTLNTPIWKSSTGYFVTKVVKEPK